MQPQKKNIREEYAALLRREGELLSQLRVVRAAMPEIERLIIQDDERANLGNGTGRQYVRDVEDVTPEEWANRAIGMANAKAAESVMVAADEKKNAKARCRTTARAKEKARRSIKELLENAA